MVLLENFGAEPLTVKLGRSNGSGAPRAKARCYSTRYGGRNPPKQTLLRSFGASKGTLFALIYGLRNRACRPKCLPVGRQALRHAGVAFCVGG